MAWTLPQAWAKNQVGAGATSAAVTLSTPTTGNMLAAILLWLDFVNSTAGTVTFKDANNVSFSITASSPANNDPVNAGELYLAWLQVPASPNGAITCTFNTTGTGLATLWVAEYAPPSAGTIVLDNDVAGSGASGTTINTPTVSVSGSDDLCIAAALSVHQVSSVDSPWNQRAAGTGNQFSEGIGDILSRSTNVAVAMTQNVSSGWDSIAGSWKIQAAAGGAGLAIPRRMRMGVG